MRVFLLVALGVALCIPSAAAQTEGMRVHEIPHFTVTLPASYETGEPSINPLGRGQLHTSYFFDTESRRLVGVSVYTGWSWWHRFLFHRGWGASRQTPHTYERIAPESLGLSASLTELAGSAFFVTDPDSESAGVQIRGCKDKVCYSVDLGDPEAGEDATAQDLASLLAGIEA